MGSVWQICTSDGMFWPPQQGEPQDQICQIWLLSISPDGWTKNLLCFVVLLKTSSMSFSTHSRVRDAQQWASPGSAAALGVLLCILSCSFSQTLREDSPGSLQLCAQQCPAWSRALFARSPSLPGVPGGLSCSEIVASPVSNVRLMEIFSV